MNAWHDEMNWMYEYPEPPYLPEELELAKVSNISGCKKFEKVLIEKIEKAPFQTENRNTYEEVFQYFLIPLGNGEFAQNGGWDNGCAGLDTREWNWFRKSVIKYLLYRQCACGVVEDFMERWLNLVAAA